MQYGALVFILVIVIAALLQVLLALLVVPGGLMFITAVLTVLLALPVLMLLTATPPVTVNQEGIHIEPAVWPARFVRWEAVTAVKDYPLLPTPDAEVGRRTLLGRRKYRPAEGIMLVIPGLPVQYRVAGFFAGERGAPVIALTSRTHTEYDKLVKRVRICTQP